MQIFGAGADVLMRMMLCGLAAFPVLATGLAYGLARSPYTTGQNMVRRQPIPFSHEHHVGRLGLDCRYCHTSVERTAFAGLPPTATCMTCHSQLFTNARMLAPSANVRRMRRFGLTFDISPPFQIYLALVAGKRCRGDSHL